MFQSKKKSAAFSPQVFITDEAFNQARQLFTSDPSIRAKAAQLAASSDLMQYNAYDLPVVEIMGLVILAYEAQEQLNGLPPELYRVNLPLGQQDRQELERAIKKRSGQGAYGGLTQFESIMVGDPTWAMLVGISKKMQNKMAWFDKFYAQPIAGKSPQLRQYLLGYAKRLGGQNEALLNIVVTLYHELLKIEICRKNAIARGVGLHAQTEQPMRATVQPPARPQVGPPQRALILADDFVDNRHDWPISQWLALADGAYSIHYTGESIAWMAFQHITVPDGILETETSYVSGQTDHGFGLIFRLLDGANHYEFIVSANGHYRFSKSFANQISILMPWRLLPHPIRPGQRITLKVVYEGPQIALYVNGQHLGAITDGDLGQGYVGLIAYKDIHARFHSFRVWS